MGASSPFTTQSLDRAGPLAGAGLPATVDHTNP